jgi:hypothetical protein
VGSVKTNVGHLEAAAGVAGRLKSVLVIENGVIPASLNYTSGNPRIDLEKLGLLGPTRLPRAHRPIEPLRTDTERLLAGMIARILEVAPVGRNDEFLALGGDSIKGSAARRSRAGGRTRTRVIFEYPTVMELAAALDHAADKPETEGDILPSALALCRTARWAKGSSPEPSARIHNSTAPTSAKPFPVFPLTPGSQSAVIDLLAAIAARKNAMPGQVALGWLLAPSTSRTSGIRSAYVGFVTDRVGSAASVLAKVDMMKASNGTDGIKD